MLRRILQGPVCFFNNTMGQTSIWCLGPPMAFVGTPSWFVFSPVLLLYDRNYGGQVGCHRAIFSMEFILKKGPSHQHSTDWSTILLMEEILHQLSKYPIICRVFIHPRWLARFLPSTVSTHDTDDLLRCFQFALWCFARETSYWKGKAVLLAARHLDFGISQTCSHPFWDV